MGSRQRRRLRSHQNAREGEREPGLPPEKRDAGEKPHPVVSTPWGPQRRAGARRGGREGRAPPGRVSPGRLPCPQSQLRAAAASPPEPLRSRLLLGSGTATNAERGQVQGGPRQGRLSLSLSRRGSPANRHQDAPGAPKGHFAGFLSPHGKFPPCHQMQCHSQSLPQVAPQRPSTPTAPPGCSPGSWEGHRRAMGGLRKGKAHGPRAHGPTKHLSPGDKICRRPWT